MVPAEKQQRLCKHLVWVDKFQNCIELLFSVEHKHTLVPEQMEDYMQRNMQFSLFFYWKYQLNALSYIHEIKCIFLTVQVELTSSQLYFLIVNDRSRKKNPVNK